MSKTRFSRRSNKHVDMKRKLLQRSSKGGANHKAASIPSKQGAVIKLLSQPRARPSQQS